MKEIREVIRAYEAAQRLGKHTALATVVHVEGSSYRRAGARMLITEDGQLTGAISGGCLEGDALRKALLVMKENRTMLVTYDTMDDDDAKFGVGLGCNGIIQVLIEPVDSKNENNPIHYLKAVVAQRQKAILVTLFSLKDKKAAQPGTCLLLKEDGSIINESPVFKEILLADAREALYSQQSKFANYTSGDINLTAFLEFVKPTVALVIAGAGNDAFPLVEMAAVMGWEIIVVDGRVTYAKAERFPRANRVLVAKPEQVLDQIAVDDQTVFVMVTHNYNYDMALLQRLLDKQVVYAGMLGPKKKLDRMLSELRERNFNYSDRQLSTIHTPVGLNIGAETAEEIALSVLAEIKAVLAGKQGAFLRAEENPIHSRSEARIEERKLN